MCLLAPTVVHRILEIDPAFGHNRADEEDVDIVFDCDEFGVVDARFFGQSLTIFGDASLHRRETQFWLALQHASSAPVFVDDAMFGRLYAVLIASFATVGQDRPVDA